METTKRDWIEIDLEGSIDDAIAKLQALKVEHPDGTVELDNYMEYGEHYSRLRINFTRDKEPIELDYDHWRAKFDRFNALSKSAQTFSAEGVDFPRQAELDGLRLELGAWAAPGWSTDLTIFGEQLVMYDHMRGGFLRDGTWVFRNMMADHYDELLKTAAATSP